MRKAFLAAGVLLASSLALAACGQKGNLAPKAIKAPPPYGRDQVQTIEDQLTPPPQAAPQRSVELHTRSEPRADDPFELPPKN